MGAFRRFRQFRRFSSVSALSLEFPLTDAADGQTKWTDRMNRPNELNGLTARADRPNTQTEVYGSIEPTRPDPTRPKPTRPDPTGPNRTGTRSDRTGPHQLENMGVKCQGAGPSSKLHQEEGEGGGEKRRKPKRRRRENERKRN